MNLPWSRLFLLAAVLLFLLSTLIGGGVISMPGSGWVLPGGLAALALAFLVA